MAKPNLVALPNRLRVWPAKGHGISHPAQQLLIHRRAIQIEDADNATH
ncbi:MAG: hypothetical protein ABIP14_00785 [Blastocatellia bacterium]